MWGLAARLHSVGSNSRYSLLRDLRSSSGDADGFHSMLFDLSDDSQIAKSDRFLKTMIAVCYLAEMVGVLKLCFLGLGRVAVDNDS